MTQAVVGTCFNIQYLQDTYTMGCSNPSQILYSSSSGNLVIDATATQWAVGLWYRNVNSCTRGTYTQLIVSTYKALFNIYN